MPQRVLLTQTVLSMGHVLLSALHRTTLAQDRAPEAQIPRLGVIVNEKHSQSELDEHGVR